MKALAAHRAAWFASLCVVCVAVASAYVMRAAASRNGDSSIASVPVGDIEAIAGRPRLLFESTAAGLGQGHLSLSALDHPEGPRAFTDLECARADFVADIGVCVTDHRSPLDPSKALIFDISDRVLYTIRIGGIPSRARVSSDGKWAAVTTFVSGHSYAGGGFSTQTLILDLERGRVVDDLERFKIFRDGREMRELDFNLWGVTFAADSDRLYATLGTGSHRYLVTGSLSERRLEVVRDDTECPSLSPDGRRIAYKKRISHGDGPLTWRLTVLDLQTKVETQLAETRSVDDQAEWLDDENVLYGLRRGTDGSEADHQRPADTWIVPADGSGSPRLFVPEAWSTVVVPH